MEWVGDVLEDFLNAVRQQVFPVRGREIVFEVFNGNWDFKAWLLDTGIQIQGLVSIPRQKATSTAHVWMFVSRKAHGWG